MIKLTAEQQALFEDAIGAGTSWPKHTSDPLVNYMVDCTVEPDDVPEYDAAFYEAEIAAFAADKEIGGL